MEKFGDISDLRCNYDKTLVVPIGTNTVIPSNLHGFTVSNKIKLLGLEISNDLNLLTENFVVIRDKIVSLVLFWERFNLTLPGRIAIIKTLLLPQLNYLGSFLTPDDEILSSIQKILDDFALNGQTMSRDCRYLNPEHGGAGLINIRDFLIAQKCSWIKRAAGNVIDNWRLSLAIAAPEGDILNIRSCDVDPKQHLILYELAWAYEFFIGCYSLIDNNHLRNNVFQNAAFVRSGRDNLLLDSNFFGKKYYIENKSRIRKLTFEDCFTDGKFKSINEFAGNVGLVFPPLTWLNLQTAITYAKKILAKTSNGDKKGMPVSKFVGRFKKGSKPFRQTIDNATYMGESCLDLTIVKTYARITHNAVQSEEITKKFLSSWNFVYLDNKLREFIYKCRHNILRTGDRLSHILNTDSNCFFCRNLPQQSMVPE